MENKFYRHIIYTYTDCPRIVNVPAGGARYGHVPPVAVCLF